MIACELHAKPQWTTADCRDCYVCRLQQVNKELLAACEAAVDDDPCRLDHHGCCQTHRLGKPCEQLLLRTAIAKARGES